MKAHVLLAALAGAAALVGVVMAIPPPAPPPLGPVEARAPDGPVPPAIADKPNIVILLADDWGFTDVGAFGGEMATPHLDALAANGVRFSNFHVAGSCSPTRAMLQTGVINHRAGLGNMPETIPPEHLGQPGYDSHLNDRVVTIADQLRAVGYRTYLTGKWHLGHTPDTLPTARGYERAFALSQSGADNFEDKPNLLLYDHADWTENGRRVSLPERFYSSTLIVGRMLAYIDADRAGDRRPFLASVNFIANHIPVQAADADIAAYGGRYDAGWDALREARRRGAISAGVMPEGMAMVRMGTTGDWARLSAEERAQRSGAMEAYGAMATAMDREVGRLVDHLKSIGEYDRTIFVFLSDNGGEATDPMAAGGFTTFNARLLYDQSVEQQGRPGSLTAIGAAWASAVSAPLNGYKFTASEGGIRVPLIMAWPGNPAFRQGSVAGGFAHVTDVTPTLLSLAGVPAQAGQWQGRAVEPMIGRDLTPMLTGGAEDVRPDDAPFGYELSGNAVLFKGDWKMVRNLPPYGSGEWELYNMVADPGETANLASREPARLAEMQADYARFAADNGVLDMPEGYTAPRQIFENAMSNLLVPRLLQLAPWVAALLLGLSALVAWWRDWRRARAAPA